MAELNLWEIYGTVQAGVDSFPAELKQLLTRHEAAVICPDWLKKVHPRETLRETTSLAVFQWDMVGMWFAQQNRLHEAISIHRELYHLMCLAQEGHGWVHKGLPLVRLRDWHRRLGHPWHEERYLLLTLVEDAIRGQGLIELSTSGIYHRFRWEDGRSHDEFQTLSREIWKEYSLKREFREFPEQILARMSPHAMKTAATALEADIYEINPTLAGKLYQKAAAEDWRALETLAAYELSCVPGFEVSVQKPSQSSVFDGLVHIKGQMVDFRRELGTYLLVECKDWKKPIDSEPIAYLAQNLVFHECKAGILFSWSGITGTGEMKNAALTVLRAYHHAGKAIIVLDHNDFRSAAEGTPLQGILRKKYEEVRFDLRR